MRKISFSLLVCLLVIALVLPMTAFAAEEETLWSNEFSRIMDITDSLSAAEKQRLESSSAEFLQNYHLDLSVAAIPESRLESSDMKEFAAELYESCDFGYGDGKDGFICLYLVDTEELEIVPMGGAVDLLPQKYLDFMKERVPTLREKHGVYGVFYGCQELIRNGLDSMAEKAVDTILESETVSESLSVEVPEIETAPTSGNGDFARCGEGSDKPAWFPADLDEAYVYFDADAPRVVDYANIISEDTEAAMELRIAEISAEIGKDVVIVTDVSSYGLGEDIYAADFYDYNGYGIGPEHEGILLFLNMDPNDRGGWTVETGSETRALLTQSVANRLDDFLYDTLATGNYERALSDWIEDVYSVFTKGIARAPFWYHRDGELPADFYDPDAPVVVDEWNILTQEQITSLRECSETLKEAYGVNVYFHTTGDQLGMKAEAYNARYMESMGYEKDAILFAVENTGGDTIEYAYAYTYGNACERVPEKFRSRIENNASTADDGYGRLFEEQRLLSVYLEHGRVPRNGFYWTMIAVLSVVIGAAVGLFFMKKAESGMVTVSRQTSAHSYLDRAHTTLKRIRETFLYMTTSRTYVSPRSTGSSSGSSGSRSTYKSSYSGHSGTTHSGHGRKF